MATRSKKVQEPRGTATTKKAARAGDRYLDLVRMCPLRVIRSEEEYDQVIEMLNRLSDVGRDRTPDEREYLLALAVFVEKYEDVHYPIPPASGAEMLRYLIEARELKQSDVAAGVALADLTISEIRREAETEGQAHRPPGTVLQGQARILPGRLRHSRSSILLRAVIPVHVPIQTHAHRCKPRRRGGPCSGCSGLRSGGGGDRSRRSRPAGS